MNGSLKGSEVIRKEQHSSLRKIRAAGWVLDFLSILFVAGTIGVGLLFTILFNDPHSRFNPLPPPIMPELALANKPFLGNKSILSQTQTMMTSTIDARSAPQLLTDSSMSVSENPSPLTSDQESENYFDKRDDFPASNAAAIQVDDGWYELEAADQNFERVYFQISNQLEPVLSKNRVASSFSESASTDQTPPETPPSDDGISDLFTSEVQYWEEEILAWGEEYGLDPNLIATVMQLESCGYTRAKSAAGALGLFQVMPDHFKKKENPYDPDTNAFRGLRWLQKTIRSSDSIRIALAGYNAGLARVNNPNLEWPAETQRYANWGFNIYLDTQAGYDYSPALHNWLSKGGSHLCNLAAAEQQEK